MATGVAAVAAAAALGAPLHDRQQPADRNQAGNPLDAGDHHPMSRRWVPAPGVRGLPPGVAALAHVNVSASAPYLGGELMVSSLVAASPQACLAALLPAPAAGSNSSSCSSSFLGPAAAVTLLEEPRPGCQVLHVRLAPPCAPSSGSGSSAWAAWLCQLCAPREAVVQLTRSEDAASGISCVLFSSLPDKQALELLRQHRRRRPSSSSSSKHPAAAGAGAAPVSPWPSQQQHHHHKHHHKHHRRHGWQLGRSLRAAAAAATPRWFSSSGGGWQLGSWLWRPLLVGIAGGFTVGGLSSSGGSTNGSGAAPGETLVTQLLKVDLRGWLCQPTASAAGSSGSGASSSSNWLGRLGQGAADELLRGMLAAVPALKQQLEQQLEQQAGASQANGCSMQQAAAGGASAVSSCQPGTLAGALRGLLGGLLPWRWGAKGSISSDQGAAGAEASALSEAAAAAEPEACRQLSQAGLSLVGVDVNWQPLLGQCNPAFWSELHQPGGPAPFKVRGGSYLTDRSKVAAGPAAFALLAVDLVTTPSAVSHIARFLPSVRRSRAPACFVANMMVPQPGNVLNLVMTFGCSRPWPEQGGSSGSSNSSGSSTAGDSMHGSASSSALQGQQPESGWSSFDHALHRFVSGDDATRTAMLKMIPHVEVGPWLLRQSVGTTPFIVGRKLATRVLLTRRYLEVDLDVTTCQAAAYIVSSIRGMTTALTIDLAFVLEGQRPQELPECLLGAVRFSGIDLAAAVPLDMRDGAEVPEWPAPWQGQSG